MKDDEIFYIELTRDQSRLVASAISDKVAELRKASDDPLISAYSRTKVKKDLTTLWRAWSKFEN